MRSSHGFRDVALGRKNWLYAGSDKGGERAATIYYLVETAKLNGLDPEAYLRDVLTRTSATSRDACPGVGRSHLAIWRHE